MRLSTPTNTYVVNTQEKQPTDQTSTIPPYHTQESLVLEARGKEDPITSLRIHTYLCMYLTIVIKIVARSDNSRACSWQSASNWYSTTEGFIHVMIDGKIETYHYLEEVNITKKPRYKKPPPPRDPIYV